MLQVKREGRKTEESVAAGNLGVNPPWPRLVNSREESYGIGTSSDDLL